MADEEFGDQKFRDFMNTEYNSKTDPLIIIIEALHCKISAIREIYSKTLDTYASLKDDDPMRKELIEDKKNLMDIFTRTMEQFDLAMIDEGDDDGDELKEMEEDERGPID